MILNSKNNQFVFRFPKGFIPADLEEKYNFYLKRLPTPFANITDYVNHTVQSVTFPSVASDEVEQWVGRRTSAGEKFVSKNPQYWRQSLDLERVVPKEFSVNLKATDGYLNYWVLYETYRNYLSIPNMDDYFPDMNIMYLDRDGYQVLTVDFKQPIMKGISEVEMNYSSTAIEFRTFTVNFKYNTFNIAVKLD
jgi:hypothetical protein